MILMKRLALFSLTLFGMVALSSCGGSGNGELIGVQGREAYFPGEPYGMVFIPQGNFQAG